jgi:hypothetical protein
MGRLDTSRITKNRRERRKIKNSSNKESSQDNVDAFIVALVTQELDNFWLIDLGVSFHIISHRAWF